MKVLVACESSGLIREAFAARGHKAYSCDLKDSEIPSPLHIQDDVRKILFAFEWDIVIAHPPCTELTNAANRWLDEDPERAARRESAIAFFKLFKDTRLKRVCIENPIPSGYAQAAIGPYSQIIQGTQFGEPDSRRTCLWLWNLPLLTATQDLGPPPNRKVKLLWQGVHRHSKTADRATNRSRTLPGVAEAMALQWG